MKKRNSFYLSLYGMVIILFIVSGCQKDIIVDNSKGYPADSLNKIYGIDSLFKNYEFPFSGWKVEYHKFYYDILVRNLYFVNPSNGFIIGQEGKILHSSDSGKTWIFQNSGTTLSLESIFFINDSIGFISGEGETGCKEPDCNKGSFLLKTTDGGRHWTKILYGHFQFLETMHFEDQNNGLAIMKTTEGSVPEIRYLVKTSDEGALWNKINVSLPNWPNDIFSFGKIKFILGSNNNIFKSNDNGNNWESLNAPIDTTRHSKINYIYFINDRFGFISNNVKVFKTNDGGFTWTNLKTPFSSINGIHFINENEGFIFVPLVIYGDYASKTIGIYICITNDGGETWTKSELIDLLKFYLSFSYFPGPKIGYGLGFGLEGSLFYRFIKE